MSKYLELVEGSFNESHFSKQTSQNPYIAYSIEEDKVIYSIIGDDEPITYDPYVTFIAEEANSSIKLTKLSTNQILEYSTDTVTWTRMNTIIAPTIYLPNIGNKVYIRGILSADNSTSNYTRFTMTGKIAAYGNCNALWNYEDLNTPLKTYCGSNMFQSCTSLVTAPELPATTLAEGCYNQMFYNCTSLATVPELPATTLTDKCYKLMFGGCTSLTNITCLATDISATDCTYKWFNNVSSSGTFIKHPDMNNWTTGTSGIPEGWEVIDYAG